MTVSLRRVAEWIPAVVVFALVIAVWEGGIAAFHVQQFLLPKPSLPQTRGAGKRPSRRRRSLPPRARCGTCLVRWCSRRGEARMPCRPSPRK